MAYEGTGAKLAGSPRRMRAFFDVLRETASPTRACKAAGVTTTTAYSLRENDMEFAHAWDKCVEVAMEQLVGEGYRRGVEGVERPMVSGGHVVADADGNPVVETVYSDRLLEVLLKWRFPDQMASRVKVEVEGPLALDREVLLRMPPDERQALLLSLRSYTEHFRRHEAQKLALTHREA